MSNTVDLTGFIPDPGQDCENWDSRILDTNWQTTAAIGLTVATGGVVGVVALAAFPAQTIATAAGIGTLAYAGKRRAEGKKPFPFMYQADKQSEVKAEPVPAEAAA